MEPASLQRREVLKIVAALGMSSAVCGYSSAQQQRNEAPRNKVTFENEQVRVVLRTAAPRDDMYGAMWRNGPTLAVFMSDATVVTAAAGKEKRTDYKQGALLWNESPSAPARNGGSVEMFVYLIEPKVLASAAAMHVSANSPKPEPGGKIVLENAWVRVIEHAARPRMGVCGMGMHTHPPHLTVGLTDGRVKIIEPGKEPVIRETKAGDVFWDEGGPHAIQNLSSRSSRAFLIEFKRA